MTHVSSLGIPLRKEYVMQKTLIIDMQRPKLETLPLLTSLSP